MNDECRIMKEERRGITECGVLIVQERRKGVKREKKRCQEEFPGLVLGVPSGDVKNFPDTFSGSNGSDIGSTIEAGLPACYTEDMNNRWNPASRVRVAGLAGLVLCAAGPVFADLPEGCCDPIDAANSTALRTTLHAIVHEYHRFPCTSGCTDKWDMLMDEFDDCGADQDCDDGLYCNGAETCLKGQCQDGVAVQCDDGAACTADNCNEDGDSCEHVPDDSACDDGDPCELEECHPFVGCIVFPDDTIPPNITCPADTAIGCKESSDPQNTGQAVAIDDCDPFPLVTFEDATEDNGCDAPVLITRTWTAVDASGNDDSCEQLITILPSACPADLDCDGDIDAADLAILLGSWGPCEKCCDKCGPDLDGDGHVNAADLAQLLGAWAECG